jgi:hypothetical protein
MVQLAPSIAASPRSFPPPARPAVRRLHVDRHGLIYDPRAAGRDGAGGRPDVTTLLASILDADEELAVAWDDRRLHEALVERSLRPADGPDRPDPFAAGRELVATLESRLGPEACRDIDLGIVDIGDDLEPCLAAHLGGEPAELRRLVRKAFAPFEVADG